MSFQSASKMARLRDLSDLINTHSCRPEILFATFNSAINPCFHYKVTPSGEICDKCMYFFLTKLQLFALLLKTPVFNVLLLVAVSTVLSVSNMFPFLL